MKRRFSMGQALGAPFGLLKRRPGTVFVWGLVRLVFGCLLLAALWPMLSEMMGDFSAMAAVSEPDGEVTNEIMAQMTRFQATAQALNLVQALLGIIIFNATMRATWAGTRGDGFAFLRIGMDEVRVAVTGLAIAIGFYLALIVLIILGVGVFFAAWSLGEQVAIPIIVAYGGVATLAAIWGMSRVILIIPVSVIEKTFAFESGWALGRGQAAKLAVTGFLSCLILLVIELVFVAIVVAAAVALMGATGGAWQGMDWSGDQAPTLEQVQAAVRPLWPLLIFVIPAIFLTGFVQALFASPLASAARQLLDSGKPTTPPAKTDLLDDGLSPIVPAVAATGALGAAAHDAHGPEDGAVHAHDGHGGSTGVEAVADGHHPAHADGHGEAPGHEGHEAHADTLAEEHGQGSEAHADPHHGDAHDDHHAAPGGADHGDHDPADGHGDHHPHAPKHGDGH